MKAQLRSTLPILLFLVLSSDSILSALTYTLHAIGGYTSQPSSYTENRLPRAGDNILVTGPMQWDASLADGIHDIVLNGSNASWQIAPDATNLHLKFGSTGLDAVGAACGGSVGNPGDCANMYGFTVIRAANPCIDLTTPTGTDSTILGTVDNISPIYIRYQPLAGCANLTIKNVIITNLGGDSSYADAYSGIVFMPNGATNASVDVENVEVLNYYRLFFGGASWSDTNSSFKWIAVTSYGSRSGTSGSITIYTNRGFHRLQLYDATDSQPQTDGVYFYTTGVGTGIDIQRAFVAGNTNWRRGAYFNLGVEPGSGANIIRDLFCLNYMGSNGQEKCVVDYGPIQYGTSIYGLVSMGNIQTLSFRPQGSYQDGAPEWTNFWIEEDWTATRDEGALFVSGGKPWAHHGIVVLNGPGANQTGLFSYKGAQLRWDHMTVVGLNAHVDRDLSRGMMFGAGPYVIKNADGHSNLVIGVDVGILDCNSRTSACNGSTYRIDPPLGAGVHHNDVWDAAPGWAYFYSGGIHFENSGGTPHPSFAYGDLTVNPYLKDTSRTPFTYDQYILGGDGTGSTLIALASSRWQLSAGSLNLTQSALDYLLDGFTPMSGNAVCTGGYHGTQMGAVPCQ